MKNYSTLEEVITYLQRRCKVSSISVKELLNILHRKGRPLSLILLSLPFCLPIQIPGLSLLFGLAIAMVGLRMAFGKKIWMPKAALSKKISSPIIKNLCIKTLWVLKKTKRLVHPRLTYVCNHPIANGIFIAFLGILLTLPIPFSNFPIALSLLAMGFGILENDGIFVIIGYLISPLIFLLMLLSLKLIF